MKELYYAGLDLCKDVVFCDHMREIRNSPHALIINEAEQCLVHEMEYVNGTSERIDTGRTHIGYYYHYVTFLYRGNLYHMEASPQYPFTDVNYPGGFNFVPYRIVSASVRQQMDYNVAYRGLASIDEYKMPLRPVDHTVYMPGIYRQNENMVAGILRKQGGYRENAIWQDGKGCILLKSETWNPEHKVLRAVSLATDADGHRDSFEVDIVSQKICG